MTARNRLLLSIFPPLVLLSVTGLLVAEPAANKRGLTVSELQRMFQSPPDDARIMMRWWWFGPAVTPEGLEREMRLMKEGGIGGFEVQPVYALSLDDPARGLINHPYLSKEFLDAVRFTAATARKLGLRMDMTLGSGWPFGGPHIPVELASRRLRGEWLPVDEGSTRVTLPALKRGEEFIAAFLCGGATEKLDPETLVELKEVQNGEARLPAFTGRHRVLVIIASRTGQMVKRAAVGAEGLVLDHLNRTALEKHLEVVGEQLYNAAGPGSIRAMFCDSLEVYGANWATDFLEEFRKRRGYDLRPLLPALFADIGPRTEAVRHDWGQTLSELLGERFIVPLAEWCHRRNLLLRMQTYGSPPAGLFSHAAVDLPEGEGVPWTRFTSSRWGSSAGHNYGRRVISSETWTWLHSPAFRATPLDVKAEADQHFLQGINQLIGHGWPYSPEQAGKPGWRFYAAAVFNQNNPWWPAMPDIARYLQRVSFMLRQGEPANDIALYVPTHDAWAHFTIGRASLNRGIADRIGPQLIPRLLEAGYNFDLVDDEVITKLGRVEKGGLAVRGHRFPIILLPGVERIPVETLEKLGEFARQGGVLIATRRLPGTAPGLAGQKAMSAEIRKRVRELFESEQAPGHFVREENEGLVRALHALHRPDVVLSPPAPSVGFIRRDAGDVQIYFIANTGNERLKLEANFRVAGSTPEWWDAHTGDVTPARVVKDAGGGTTLDLELEPYGSKLLVFSRRASRPRKTGAIELPKPLDLNGAWEVTFIDTGKRISLDVFRSWTDDPDTRFYSGLAEYRRTFSVPGQFVRKDIRTFVDLGETSPVTPNPKARFRAWVDAPVREAAVVYVNGRRAGAAWRPPYEVDVTGLLRSGANELKIVVGNLAINKMAGEPLPDYRDLHARYGRKFDPQDMGNLQPVPSGLLGAVRLVAREPLSLIRP